MKVIVGAALALGVVLGGGQTLATNLVSDQVSSVDDPTTPPDDGTDPTDPTTTDPADTDGDTTDEGADEATDDGTEPESDDAGEGPAEINYGQLVKAWLVCSKAEPPADDPVVEPVDPAVDPADEPVVTVVDCGTRPHPPGVATGFDAAHAKDHSAHGKSAHLKPDHSAKHGGTAHGRGHGKRS